jgi:hypothetical protein
MGFQEQRLCPDEHLDVHRGFLWANQYFDGAYKSTTGKKTQLEDGSIQISRSVGMDLPNWGISKR